MPTAFERAVSAMPEGIAASLGRLPTERKAAAEEIRLRLGLPPGITLPEGEKPLGGSPVTSADIAHVLQRFSRSSLHSVQHELRRGYISGEGGLRLGVCGLAAGESIRDISSLALRIPHEVRGAGGEAIGRLRPFDSSVLILSPPGGGKTTFLRELIRHSSEWGRRVSLCDERCEVAAMSGGKSAFDLGPRTDVLSGVLKAEGISMLLRSMNPQIIALDEISSASDLPAIEQAACCGVSVIATAHAAGVDEMRKRPYYRGVLELGLFEKAVVIELGEQRKYKVVELC